MNTPFAMKRKGGKFSTTDGRGCTRIFQNEKVNREPCEICEICERILFDSVFAYLAYFAVENDFCNGQELSRSDSGN
jgi:hypothetical protein